MYMYSKYNKSEHEQKQETFKTILILALGVLVGVLLLCIIKTCIPEQAHAGKDCRQCHTPTRHQQMTDYFRLKGSPAPEKMATAVLMTSRPRTLAAIATVESGGNPKLRKTGYKKRHDGAFQVNSEYHGTVSHDPVRQALQADAILTELTGKMPLEKALSVYGGNTSGQWYQRTVLAELARVP